MSILLRASQSIDQPSVLAISLLLLCCLPFLLLLLRRKAVPHGRPLPSPPRLPFIGNLHQIGSLPHRSLAALSDKYGPLLLVHMGQVPTLLVSSPDMAKEITRTHDVVFSDRPSLKGASILMYNSMDVGFVRYGDYWRQAKKLCSLHLLSTAKVRANQYKREEEVARMIEKISRASSSTGGNVVDMREIFGLYINDLVCRAISGTRLLGGDRNARVWQLLKDSIFVFGEIFIGDYFPALGWVDDWFGMSVRTKRLQKRWDVFFDELIKDQLDHLKDDDGEEKGFLHEFLAHLDKEEMEVPLTMDHIKGILVDMFTAGTDTSHVTLEWCMAELIQSPEAMKRLQDELRGTAAAKDKVTGDELEKMSYLKAVVKEVLRLHPPAPLLLPRETMEECQLQGYHVPKGTRVLINAWAIARDPRFWEAPDEFRPERFLDSAVDYKGNDFQFIPFGSGRRICSGMPFAVASVENAVANLVQQFDWEVPRGWEKEFDATEAPGLTMRLRNGLHLVPKPWRP